MLYHYEYNIKYECYIQIFNYSLDTCIVIQPVDLRRVVFWLIGIAIY